MQRIAYHVPKRKSVAAGVVLAVLGLCGVALGAIVYPTWQQNRDTLQTKEAFGLDTPEDHDTVNTQTTLVLGGFLVGGPMLLIGIVLVASALSYNSKLDTVTLQRAFTPVAQHYNMPSGQPAFCPYCGQPVEGKPFCAYCGRKA